MRFGSTLVSLIAVAAFSMSPVGAEAREPEECQMAWGQAVRSYLTQNRTENHWKPILGENDTAFASACQLEVGGKKDDARVEAVMIGAKALAQLDPKGCQRFMASYVNSSKPKDVCDAAAGGDDARLRKLITQSMPARK